MDGPAPEATSDAAALFARARVGDRAAFERLALRYEPALRRFAYHLLGRLDLADDLVQETFLRAVVSLPGLREPERFGAWLFGIAANLAKWWWRQQTQWPVSLDALEAEYPDVAWERLTGPVWSEEVVEEAEQNWRLQEAIAALPAPLAQALTLHYLDGLSYAEMAAALRVPISTVKGRLFKSRALLRHALGPEFDTAPRARKPKRSRKRGVTITMADAAEQAQGRLVPVVIETVQTKLDGPTPENVRRLLERSTPTSVGGRPRPDLTPAVERLAPALAGLNVQLESYGRAIVLRETAGERTLTIDIGQAEAFTLSIHLQHRVPPRPFGPDLMKALVEAGSLQLDHVAVTHLEDETYHAVIVVKQLDGRAQDVDARPSDAINLAARTGAPIFVAEHLLQRQKPPAPG